MNCIRRVVDVTQRHKIINVEVRRDLKGNLGLTYTMMSTELAGDTYSDGTQSTFTKIWEAGIDKNKKREIACPKKIWQK